MNKVITLPNKEELIVRQLKKEDTEKLHIYYHNLSTESQSRFKPHSFDKSYLKNELKKKNTNTYRYVAIKPDQQQIVAYVVVINGYVSTDVPRLLKYGMALNPFQDFTIAPSVADEYQSKGLGTLLFKAIFKSLKKKKANRILLWGGVQSSNEKAVNFYLKNGFRKIGAFDHNGKNYDMVKNFNDLLYEKQKWLKDLIIYEINPYAFTSTNNVAGSGTFKSLSEKMDYIQDIGITGIWLAGYCKSTSHFKNIPSVYACNRPDELDPRLGTEGDFKQMIDHAHKKGIKVFLDVITHGVTKDSPLIQLHPEWFRGSSWEMIDYDYTNHEFREWWINTWVNYCIKFGIDGFRLDGPNGVQPYESIIQIWDEIVTTCGKKGHQVLVFPENCAYHFQQGLDVPFEKGKLIEHFTKVPSYKCKAISNHDFGIDHTAKDSFYQLKGSRYKLGYEFIFSYNIPLLMSGEEFNADFIPLPNAQQGLFGSGTSAGWLYASWLHWDQLKSNDKKEMLADFKKILSIKHENNDILHYDRLKTNLLPVSFECDLPDIPTPYIRYIKNKLILIIGNNTRLEAKLLIKIPLESIEVSLKGNCQLTNLWSNTVKKIPVKSLLSFTTTVLPDFTKGGGIGIFKIEFK